MAAWETSTLCLIGEVMLWAGQVQGTLTELLKVEMCKGFFKKHF